MQRLATIVALAIGALGLAGCVYDPYTGTYYPCCNYYGSPYYRYPYPPYGYPSQSPYYAPPGQTAPPGGYSSQPMPPPPARPGASAYPSGGGPLQQRFESANTSRDGRLTREQAQAGMPMVARNFDAIDRDHKGYVTLPEVRRFVALQRAERSDPHQSSVQ